jgi:hypothetical protein
VSSAWQLERLPGGEPVAISRDRVRWTLVDRGHHTFVGGSLDDVLIRAARAGRDASSRSHTGDRERELARR